MGSYLSRYDRGEREAVWQALVGLGEGVRDDLVLAVARAVATATMKRANHNVEELATRHGSTRRGTSSSPSRIT